MTFNQSRSSHIKPRWHPKWPLIPRFQYDYSHNDLSILCIHGPHQSLDQLNIMLYTAWLWSYLFQRRQYVSYVITNSYTEIMYVGVPQRSGLGPFCSYYTLMTYLYLCHIANRYYSPTTRPYNTLDII